MRWAVCRCLRGAFRSDSSTASTKSTAAFSFQRGRSVFFRGFGNALPIASRTMRRCTPTFWATPAIVPTPNSYSRRICSNNSTLALQSNEFPPLRASPESEYPFVYRVGQNKMPNWARSEYRNHREVGCGNYPLIGIIGSQLALGEVGQVRPSLVAHIEPPLPPQPRQFAH